MNSWLTRRVWFRDPSALSRLQPSLLPVPSAEGPRLLPLHGKRRSNVVELPCQGAPAQWTRRDTGSNRRAKAAARWLGAQRDNALPPPGNGQTFISPPRRGVRRLDRARRCRGLIRNSLYTWQLGSYLGDSDRNRWGSPGRVPRETQSCRRLRCWSPRAIAPKQEKRAPRRVSQTHPLLRATEPRMRVAGFF